MFYLAPFPKYYAAKEVESHPMIVLAMVEEIPSKCDVKLITLINDTLCYFPVKTA